MFGAWEIVLVLFLVLLLFGGKRLPELARSLGIGIREFKKASQDITAELEEEAPKQEKKETEKKELASKDQER